MRTILLRTALVLLLTALALGACRKTLTPEKDLYDSLGRFVQSLRWMDINGAGRFFQDAEMGRAFREQLRRRAGLNMTDVRLAQVVMTPEKTRATVTIEMEYFVLPSASVVRHEIVQQWQMSPELDLTGSKWFILTPFPALP